MIAAQLQLSLAEVMACRGRVMNKLHVRNVACLTRYGVANRLVPLNTTHVPEANGTTPAQDPVWSSSAPAHNESRACLVGELTTHDLAKAIERSVCAGNDFSFGLRHGPFGLQESTPDHEHGMHLTSITDRERDVIISLPDGLSDKET